MKSSMKMTTTDMDNSTMESLALPPELYWDCKAEPVSPMSGELFSMTEPAGFWLTDDNLENGIKMVTDEDFELKPGMELLNGDDLVLEFYDLKEEWPDNKLPPLDVDSAIVHPNQVTKVYNSFDNEALKSENFESAVLTTLTPPQSPPQTSLTARILQNAISTEGAVNFNNFLQHSTTPATTVSHIPTTPAPQQQQQSLPFASYYNAAPFTPSSAAVSEQTDDDKRNSQIVDDILRTFIKELPDLNDECESNSSTSSYSIATRPESIVTDEEWSPESSSFSSASSASSSPIYNGGDGSGSGEENAQFMLSKSGAVGGKKRTRPYGRGVEDRKIRKKEQNKNAATRYRQKKKIEMESVLNEEQQLTQRNDELRRVLAERKREAKYLKTLIKEFYSKQKGSKKA